MSCYKFVVPSHVVDSGMLPDGRLNIRGRRAAAENLRSRGARWGDVAKLEVVQDYRNDGVYMFDGSFLIDLDYKENDYGAVPSTFTPIEYGYPLNYWRCIDNTIVWVRADTIRSGLIKGPVRGPITHVGGPLYDHIVFRHKGTDYYILGPEHERISRLNVSALESILVSDRMVIPLELILDPSLPANTLGA